MIDHSSGNEFASTGLNPRDPCTSLTCALQAIAARAGYAIDHDDLNAALGLSWMVSAVPGVNDPGDWPMYARDAFLVEAGRMFGMTIRDIHPPEAARGLTGVAEFEQHFDASYRPLIMRALEHGQPVLAWRGWPGEGNLLWGVINGTCPEGIGFAGSKYLTVPDIQTGSQLPHAPQTARGKARGSVHSEAIAPEATCSPELIALDRPPVQLYVVETINPTTPDPVDLLDLALDHARRVLDNALAERFGIVTGPNAYDLWMDRLARTKANEDAGRAPPAEAKPDEELVGQVERSETRRTSLPAETQQTPHRAQPDLRIALFEGHRRLVDSIVNAHRSACRFLVRIRARTAKHAGPALAHLENLCADVIRVLAEAATLTHPTDADSERRSYNRLAQLLKQAKTVTVTMRDTLDAA